MAVDKIADSADTTQLHFNPNCRFAPICSHCNGLRSCTGSDELILKARAFPIDWSRDGRNLLFMIDGGVTHYDVSGVPPCGAPRPVAKSSV